MTSMTSMDDITKLGDSFINAALDTLESEVVAPLESASLGAEVSQHILGSAALAEVREAVTFWSAFELDKKREDWRDAAVQVSQMQEAGEGSKRDLGEKAKAAKAGGASEADKKKLVSALMGEVKTLTRRAHFAETAFMSMLNDLDEAPDPGAPLTNAARSAEFVSRTGAESAGLRRELEASRAELAAAKEAAASGRDSKAATELRALRSSMQQRVDAAVEDRLSAADKRVAELEVTAEAAAAARVRAEEALGEMRVKYDAAQTQLFEIEEAREQGWTMAAGEAETLAAEAERLRQRESAARGEAQRLQHELDGLRAAAGLSSREDTADAAVDATAAATSAALRERLAVRDKVVEQLKAALEEAESQAERDAENARAAATTAAKELARAREAAERAEAELAARPSAADVEALTGRVRTLQALVDADDGDALEAAAASAANGDDAAAPLVAAQRRNRRLNDELSGAQRAATEARRDAEAAAARAEDVQRVVEAQARTIEELEAHLATAVGTSIPPMSTGALRLIEGEAGGGGEGTARTLGAIMTSSDGAPRGDAEGGTGVSPSSDAGLLPVIVGQRDRYAARVATLEARAGELEAELAGVRADHAKTQADNVSLFEKVKYLQSYYAKHLPENPAKIVRVDEAGVPVGAGGNAGTSHRLACGPMLIAVDGGAAVNMRRRAQRYGCLPAPPGGAPELSTDIAKLPGGDASGAIARYDQAYQARLNPYAQFQASERDGAVAGLPVHDRVALGGARALLRSRAARVFFVAYVALMHVFLAGVLYANALRSRVAYEAASQDPAAA